MIGKHCYHIEDDGEFCCKKVIWKIESKNAPGEFIYACADHVFMLLNQNKDDDNILFNEMKENNCNDFV